MISYKTQTRLIQIYFLKIKIGTVDLNSRKHNQFSTALINTKRPYCLKLEDIIKKEH